MTFARLASPISLALFAFAMATLTAHAARAEALSERFPTPPGFTRAAVDPLSFAAYLRALPLAPPGTPVTSYRGDVIRGGDDEHVAAVSSLDLTPADLQQCADSVIRLHAEWLWSRGRRDATYFAASGTAMPFARWARGERPVLSGPHGNTLEWKPMARPQSDHDAYRRYLDSVFAYANTVSLAKHSIAVAASDVRAGDFFVHPGWPGHVVIVLDVARGEGGTRALLGQGYMPAQSFHVMRPSRDSAWFTLDPKAPLETPFWAEFPWSELRRFE